MMVRLISHLLITILLGVSSVFSNPDDGPPNEVGRIVGGIIAPVNTVPWIVSLQILGYHQCGGSIISSKRILTAAYCTADVPPFLWTIRAGSLNYATGGQLIPVQSVAQHADYNNQTLTNDISILKLAAELNMRLSGVRAIKLPDQDAAIRDGSAALVAGWGYTSENGGNISSVLRLVTVLLVNQKKCNESNSGAIDDGMVCAARSGRDSCTFDSGGPLTLNNRLIGIVSWGAGCARPDKPGVYTRVAYFRDWIDNNV